MNVEIIGVVLYCTYRLPAIIYIFPAAVVASISLNIGEPWNFLLAFFVLCYNWFRRFPSNLSNLSPEWIVTPLKECFGESFNHLPYWFDLLYCQWLVIFVWGLREFRLLRKVFILLHDYRCAYGLWVITFFTRNITQFRALNYFLKDLAFFYFFLHLCTDLPLVFPQVCPNSSKIDAREQIVQMFNLQFFYDAKRHVTLVFGDIGTLIASYLYIEINVKYWTCVFALIFLRWGTNGFIFWDIGLALYCFFKLARFFSVAGTPFFSFCKCLTYGVGIFGYISLSWRVLTDTGILPTFKEILRDYFNCHKLKAEETFSFCSNL